MTVLLRLDDDRRPDVTSAEKTARAAFRAVSNAYNDATDVDDSYLYDPGHGYAGELDFVDGRTDPDKVIGTARGWNESLQKDFGTVMNQMRDDANFAIGNYLGMPKTLIYQLKKAAMALDGDFYAFADRALLVNKAGYMTTVLKTEELDDVLRNPQDYAVIEVAPK